MDYVYVCENPKCSQHKTHSDVNICFGCTHTRVLRSVRKRTLLFITPVDRVVPYSSGYVVIWRDRQQCIVYRTAAEANKELRRLARLFRPGRETR